MRRGEPYDLEAAGPSGAPRLLLLHGVALNRGMWQAQMAALRDRWRVLALDLLGHGTRRSDLFTFDAAAARVTEVVTSQPRPVVVVGASLGGYVGLEAAAGHPANLAGLMLIGASADPRRWLLRMLAGRLYPPLLGALPERQVERLQLALLRHSLPELADALAPGGFAYRAAGNVYQQVAGRDYLALAQRVVVPTLVVNGARDRTNRRDAAALLGALPDGVERVVPKAGHEVTLQRPREVNALIDDFADRVTAMTD